MAMLILMMGAGGECPKKNQGQKPPGGRRH